MPKIQGTATSATDGTYRALVRVDKLKLLYSQSLHGVFASVVAAGLWLALMWPYAAHSGLLAWFAVLCVLAFARVVLFLSYRRQKPDGDALLKWETPYAITLLLSAIVWGFGTVIVMPADSLLAQTITYVFMFGLAGSALPAYGVFMNMALGTISSVLLPIIAYFLYRGESVTVLMAVSGIWFLLASLRSLSVHNATVETSFRLAYQLRDATREAEIHAKTDSLTGLNNRRSFTAAADTLLKVAAREKRPTTIMLIDIDDFKLINDQHGHSAGDEALVWLATQLISHLRESDVSGRLGGDEFAVVLPNTSIEAAREVAEKLRTAAAAVDGYTSLQPLSLSIGIASGFGNTEALLHRADIAMYEAKRAGKNLVVIAAGE